MYQILCDGYILYDPRDDELILLEPKCKLSVNSVCEGSFSILPTHPYYDKLQKLKSIIEIKQNDDVIFRGRMTEDSTDFNKQLDVDLEGVLSFANDSIIPPFNFPADANPEAEQADNIVEFFLGWILEQHNSQVQDWQKLKLGRVTVTDPLNYIVRETEDYTSTWDILKTKLFDSELGGYLICRYEDDGNYVDYLSGFDVTNTQKVTLSENLLDISINSNAAATYSAILPFGAEVENFDGTKSKLTVESFGDGNITDDLIKYGLYIYSQSAVDAYGWRCVPPSESKWDDVTTTKNLRTKAIEYLTGTAMLQAKTITVKAIDLGFSDDEIQSFRIGRNVLCDIPSHGMNNVSYPLTTLEPDILNPENTNITIGDTVRTLTDSTSKGLSNTIQRVEVIEKDVAVGKNNFATKVELEEALSNVSGLTAGDNITIKDGVISADVPKYSAGDNITIANNVISVDTADAVEENNANPVTSGAVHTALQNIGGSGEAPSMESICEAIYPVGSIYMSVNSVSPATLFGGTWEALESRFLVGASTEYPAGGTGGAKYHNHTLSSAGYAEISAYKSNSRIGQGVVEKSWTADQYITVSAAPTTSTVNMANATPLGGTTDTNWNALPPYLAVYMWKRTA